MAKYKYTIEVKFNNGQVSSHQADKIVFYEEKGGIDIFDNINPVPFFPGHEEDVEVITIRIN